MRQSTLRDLRFGTGAGTDPQEALRDSRPSTFSDFENLVDFEEDSRLVCVGESRASIS